MSKKSKKRNVALEKKAPSAPEWNELSQSQRVDITRKMMRTYRRVSMFAAGCYNIVGSSKHTRLRDRAQIETGGEDDALTQSLRNQFINLARNGVRNNETVNAIMHQFKVNVIGTVGGKAYFDFGPQYQEAADVLRREFAKHCEACEFFDGMSFREFLELLLETVALGGDVCIAFDNHTFENSAKLVSYEPDSIAELDEALFKKHLPGYQQRLGRIYSASNRFCGVIVSSAERGKIVFKEWDKCHVFLKDPNASRFDVDWAFIGHRWRFNQGRGTSPLAAPLGSFLDVDTLQGYEIEAAKLNSQMCAQVYQTGSDDANDAPTPSPDLARDAFNESESGDDAGDAAVETEYIDPMMNATPRFQELESAGICWNLMPANAKMEMLKSERPNPNMNEFIRVVASRGGWANGLAACFVTGAVATSYSGYRGEQILTWPTFYRWQKFLETNVCDWHFRRWFEYASKFNANVKAILSKIPENLFELVEWEWPMMKEVNAVDEQNALNMGLKNGSITFHDKFGPGWRRHLDRAAEGREYCRAIGFPHPADETVSGQIKEENKE